MFNFLKGSQKLPREEGGAVSSSIQPPKVLPELARDIYEHEKVPDISTMDSTQQGAFGSSALSEISGQQAMQAGNNSVRNSSAQSTSASTMPVVDDSSTIDDMRKALSESMSEPISNSSSISPSSVSMSSSIAPSLSNTSVSGASSNVPRFMAPPPAIVHPAMVQSVAVPEHAVSSQATSIHIPSQAMPLNEPSIESVPRLDLSLIRPSAIAQTTRSVDMSHHAAPTVENTAYVNNYANNAMPPKIPSHIHTPTPSVASNHPNYDVAPTYASNQGYPQNPLYAQNPAYNQSSNQSSGGNMPYPMSYEGMKIIDDSTGFFKEFEEYVRSNGLNNDVISGLLDKNLLDNMMFYHSAKSSEMPFYASSSELAHAVKLKFEELQNLERNWISNKQKADLLKRLGSTMESDIRLKSEELKKLVSESRTRVVPGVMQIGTKQVTPQANMVSLQTVSAQQQKSSVSSTPVLSTTNSSQTMPPPSIQSFDDDALHAEILGHIDDEISSKTPVETPIDASTENNITAPVIDPFMTPNEAPIDIQGTSHDSILDVMKNSRGLHVSISDGLHIVSDENKGFYLHNGIVLRTMHQLLDAIDDMDDSIYRRYVTDDKNDFANWVQHVFGNSVLASTLRQTKNKQQTLQVLKSYLDM